MPKKNTNIIKKKGLKKSSSSTLKSKEKSKVITYVDPLGETKWKSSDSLYKAPHKMNWRLFVDCTHNPPSLSYDSGWIVARSYKQARDLIKKYGFPKHVRYGIVHKEEKPMSFLAFCLIRWALKNKVHVIGRVTFDTTASVGRVEQFKIAKRYNVWFKKAYNHEVK